MLDFLWTICLGAWCLLGQLCKCLVFAIPLAILDYYVPGSFYVIAAVSLVGILLYYIGDAYRDMLKCRKQ